MFRCTLPSEHISPDLFLFVFFSAAGTAPCMFRVRELDLQILSRCERSCLLPSSCPFPSSSLLRIFFGFFCSHYLLPCSSLLFIFLAYLLIFVHCFSDAWSECLRFKGKNNEHVMEGIEGGSTAGTGCLRLVTGDVSVVFLLRYPGFLVLVILLFLRHFSHPFHNAVSISGQWKLYYIISP